QRVDVEEAAIVDVARCQSPVAELVVLALEQVMQRQRLHGAICVSAIGRKPTLDNVAPTFDIPEFRFETWGFLAVGMPQAAIARGEIKDALSGFTVLGPGLLDDGVQDFAVALRSNRQAMLEIPGRETAFAGVIAQLDLAAFQRLAVGRAEDRQQHAAARTIRQLLPVDIERDGVRRSLAPFQHVEPPWIIVIVYADMVGHEVEDQAEVVRFQRVAESLETRLAAEFGIDDGVIDDVIAVGRTLARFCKRRGIDVADAERLQVRHDGGGRVEIEVRGQLQTIGRDGNGWRHQRSSKRQSTDHGVIAPPAVPQIGVPGAYSACAAIAWSDRLAVSDRFAPSPRRQFAVSSPSSAASALPKRAPAR